MEGRERKRRLEEGPRRLVGPMVVLCRRRPRKNRGGREREREKGSQPIHVINFY